MADITEEASVYEVEDTDDKQRDKVITQWLGLEVGTENNPNNNRQSVRNGSCKRADGRDRSGGPSLKADENLGRL